MSLENVFMNSEYTLKSFSGNLCRTTQIKSLEQDCRFEAVSDAQVLTESGILKLLDHGDSVMANVGDLEISQLIEADNATVTEPLLCANSANDLPRVEAGGTRQDNEQMDSAVRQYLKSIIWEVKRSRLFGGVIPCNLSGHIQQLWTVNCLLCNFREPIVL